MLQYAALLLALTGASAYLNHRVLRLPRNSGLLVIAFVAALCLRLFDQVFPSVGLPTFVRQELAQANLGGLLLNGFLGFLLFAAALDVDVSELLGPKWTILALATAGVILSTMGLAAGMFAIFRLVGIGVPFTYCLVFGALISPTDPVTVLGVLERLNVGPRLRAIIAGESLFNDGVGIVLFTVFLQLAGSTRGDQVLLGAVVDFVREAGGGVLLGLGTGGVAFGLMRGIDEYKIELIISLALVTGTYAVAQQIGVSGPVAVVIAGLLMGSVGVKYAVSGTTHRYLQMFWSATDEVLNALLFLLIGLEFAAIDLRWEYLAATALAIPLSLLVRGLSITAASLPLNLAAPHKLRAITLLTWSGLRGGISIALALSLPQSEYRDALITVAYCIAVFTMIAQGLTLERIASSLYPSQRQS
jgi:monovalent cation:H+ antiporter, CPA1 family